MGRAARNLEPKATGFRGLGFGVEGYSLESTGAAFMLRKSATVAPYTLQTPTLQTCPIPHALKDLGFRVMILKPCIRNLGSCSGS